MTHTCISLRLAAVVATLPVVLLMATVTGAAATPDQWEPAIATFEAQDRQSPPPQGGIVFVGPSEHRAAHTEKIVARPPRNQPRLRRLANCRFRPLCRSHRAPLPAKGRGFLRGRQRRRGRQDARDGGQRFSGVHPKEIPPAHSRRPASSSFPSNPASAAGRWWKESPGKPPDPRLRQA